LKISITGAKLSHLVQYDEIWDHGSMTEQAKNIFYQVEKARQKKDSETIRKYLTANGYEKLKAEIEMLSRSRPFIKNSVLTEIFIIQVTPRKKQRPDSFRALVKGKRKIEEDLVPAEISNHGIENFSEEWLFTRQGEWWLLDSMRSK
jgi:predicted lipid-binding transport protein (Tim44 family)